MAATTSALGLGLAYPSVSTGTFSTELEGIGATGETASWFSVVVDPLAGTLTGVRRFLGTKLVAGPVGTNTTFTVPCFVDQAVTGKKL